VQFNVCVGNLENKNSVEDKARLLCLGLRQLGHRVSISDFILDGAINVLFECFSDAFVAELRSTHPFAQTILVGTEWITGATFNDFSETSNSTYDWKAMWKRRFDNFVALAAQARGVWCLSPYQLDDYRRLAGNRVFYLPHGFVETFAQAHRVPDEHKTIDFIFSGTLTERRLSILRELTNRGYIVRSFPPHTPAYVRLEMYSLARIVLGLKVSDRWEYPSVSRTHYCVSNRFLLVNEWHPRTSDLDPYAIASGEGSLFDTLAQVHAMAGYGARAETFLDAFRAEFPLVPALERAVDGCLAGPE